MTATEQQLEHAAVLARRYIRAYRAVLDAAPASLLDAVRDCDIALHDLTVAVNEPCWCDPGTCPGPEDMDHLRDVLSRLGDG